MKLTRAKRGIITSLIGSFFNLLLSSLKISIGLVAGSISVLLDGINNFIDIFSSGATAVGFGIADMKSNDRYPNGYGRIEYIISFLVAIVVLIVGLTFAYSALERLIIPQPIGFSWAYFYVILATVLAKVAMGEFYRRSNKKLESTALSVMVLDSYQDAAITTAVLLSFLVSQYTRFPVDAVCAFLMATIIFINCGKLLAVSFKKLLGHIDLKLKKEIENEINEIKGIVCQELFLYDYGYKNYYGNAVAVILDKEFSLEQIVEKLIGIEKTIEKKYHVKLKIAIGK